MFRMFDFFRFVVFAAEDGTGGGDANANAGGDANANAGGDANANAGGDAAAAEASKVAADAAAAEAAKKAGDTKPAAFDEKAFTDARAARVAAEAYDDKYALPEGVAPDTDGIAKLNAIGKELGLNKAELQKFVDIQVERGLEAQKQADADWNKMRSDWTAACKNDKDFGGDQYDANKGLVTRVAKALDPELPAELEKLGLTDNPVVFKALARLGKELGDDKLVFGGAKPGTQDVLRSLYNNPTSNPQ